MNIKVQLPDRISTAALIESGIHIKGQSLTFHAFSDKMKAQVLDLVAQGKERVLLSVTKDEPRTGEWMEYTGEFK